jgi:thermostable 8-oxoguanine DNA glycosylase
MTFTDVLVDEGPVITIRGEGGARSVHWGHHWQIGTAAYWVALTRDQGQRNSDPHRHRLGASLEEELAACILGGFGMPFELGLSAFQLVRDELLVHDVCPSERQIESILLRPMLMNGTMRRYRFPRQRAQRLAAALRFAHDHRISAIETVPGREIRDSLLTIPGVGLKTASWVVRNHYDAGDVAVLDVHVLRAGVRAGVFPNDASVARDYRALEDWFLDWARAGDVAASDLDAVIWRSQALEHRRSNN